MRTLFTNRAIAVLFVFPRVVIFRVPLLSAMVQRTVRVASLPVMAQLPLATTRVRGILARARCLWRPALVAHADTPVAPFRSERGQHLAQGGQHRGELVARDDQRR